MYSVCGEVERGKTRVGYQCQFNLLTCYVASSIVTGITVVNFSHSSNRERSNDGKAQKKTALSSYIIRTGCDTFNVTLFIQKFLCFGSH